MGAVQRARVAPLNEEDIRLAIAEADGLVGLLRDADRTERATLYCALGVTLTYEKKLQPGRNVSMSG